MMKQLVKAVAIVALMGMGATGCATTQVTMNAQGAPITYKIGQGSAQYASLPKRTRPVQPTLPETRPVPQSTPRGAQGPRFDASKVDKTLYAHQRVGKRYTIMGRSYTPKHEPNYDVTGEASWYGPKFHGKPTATGEIFNKNAMTAAHKTLPLNSMLHVTNLETGKSIFVRLNDRGPFIGDRIIDLSEAAAQALGYKNKGLGRVRVRYAGPADPMAADRPLPDAAPRIAELPRENLTPRRSIPVPTPSRPAPTPRAEGPSLPTPITPGQPLRTPGADLEPGGNVTLTIKGPIHIARSDDTNQARFIQERLDTTNTP